MTIRYGTSTDTEAQSADLIQGACGADPNAGPGPGLAVPRWPGRPGDGHQPYIVRSHNRGRVPLGRGNPRQALNKGLHSRPDLVDGPAHASFGYLDLQFPHPRGPLWYYKDERWTSSVAVDHDQVST
jgi:hypothetical protein